MILHYVQTLGSDSLSLMRILESVGQLSHSLILKYDAVIIGGLVSPLSLSSSLLVSFDTVRGRALAAASNALLRKTTYWAMKKQVANEAQQDTVTMMETRDCVVWADNYAHVVGHVIAKAVRGTYTCAAFTGETCVLASWKSCVLIVNDECVG